jgi:hypothetical protein
VGRRIVTKWTSLTAIALLGLLTSHASAQTEIYDFDGVADMDPQPADPTDWFTSVNWAESGFDPLPPLGPPIPDLDTQVEIRTSTFGVDAPEIRTGDAQAHQVRIGREEGAGLLTMTGGTLTIKNVFGFGNRFRVGSHDAAEQGLPLEQRFPGTFIMNGGALTVSSLWVGSGSHGEMNLSGGTVTLRENFYLDWTFDADSVLNMTGGAVNVAGVLRMFRNAQLNMTSGNFLINGTAELGTTNEDNPNWPFQAPDVNVTISGGMLAANGFMKVNGSVVLDGGVLRAANFQESLSMGTIEINEGGTLQFKNAEESIAAVNSLITGGFITTSSAQGTGAFQISVVNVSGTNYTQVTLPPAVSNGDFDMNHVVDGTDFVIWQRQFGGALDGADYTAWKANFGSTVAVRAATSAPEPGSAALAACMATGAGLARRRRACRNAGATALPA